MRTLKFLAAGLAALAALNGNPLFAADDPNTPRPIPLTRPEMKFLLEEMKARKQAEARAAREQSLRDRKRI